MMAFDDDEFGKGESRWNRNFGISCANSDPGIFFPQIPFALGHWQGNPLGFFVIVWWPG